MSTSPPSVVLELHTADRLVRTLVTEAFLREVGSVTGVAIAGGVAYVTAGDGPFRLARIGAGGLVTRIS